MSQGNDRLIMELYVSHLDLDIFCTVMIPKPHVRRLKIDLRGGWSRYLLLVLIPIVARLNKKNPSLIFSNTYLLTGQVMMGG